MKKVFAQLLAVMMCLCMAACGSSEATEPAEETTVPTQQAAAETAAPIPETTAPAEDQICAFGDPIVTEMFIFTPAFEGFTDEVGNWPDKDFLTPEGQISGSNPFKAGSEKVIMYFSGTVEYVGDSKENVQFTYTFDVDYDDGYVFSFDSYDCGFTSDIENGKWTYSNSMLFEPLSSNTTRYVRFCIEVPSQLETNTTQPLKVIFHIDGTNYIYVIR